MESDFEVGNNQLLQQKDEGSQIRFNGIPLYKGEAQQTCIICMDENAKALKSICCGAGAVCYDCLRRSYLDKVDCVFCRKDTGMTFIKNEEAWEKSRLDYEVIIMHSGTVYLAYSKKIAAEIGWKRVIFFIILLCLLFFPLNFTLNLLSSILMEIYITIGRLFMIQIDPQENWGKRYA